MHPGACSLSPHIICRELALPIDLINVDRVTHPLVGHDQRCGATINYPAMICPAGAFFGFRSDAKLKTVARVRRAKGWVAG